MESSPAWCRNMDHKRKDKKLLESSETDLDKNNEDELGTISKQ